MDILLNLSLLSSKGDNTFNGQVNKTNKLEEIVEQFLQNSAELMNPAESLKNSLKSLDEKIKGLENKPYYLCQPLGSQRFPDFVLLLPVNNEEHLVLYIECKSSKKGIPLWNCTYPKRMSNVIYIINKTSDGSVIVMNGLDAITENDYKLLYSFNEKLENWKREVDDYNSKLKQFYYYPRNMYTQSLKYDFNKAYNIIDNLEFHFSKASKDLSEQKNMNENYDIKMSLEYVNSVSREYRNEMGQFFTSKNIKEKCIELVSKYIEPKKVLEPSYGTGEFFHSICDKWENIQITGIELDPVLGKIIHQGIKTYNVDFLTSKINCQYDLIIGNPPYFELKSNSKYKSMYSHIIQGRFNIYALFIYKSITLLQENGVLCFVIPESIKSSPSFSKLRKFISENCEILELFSMGNFSSEVSQGCIIFMCQRKSKGITGKFVNPLTLVFSTETSQSKTIQDTGVLVKTGSVVWNKHKDKLYDVREECKEYSSLLIYSDSILSKNEESKRNPEKKKYIGLKGTRESVILVSRSSGKNIKCALYLNPQEDYLVENHVNVITGDVETLKNVYKSLISEDTKKYLNETMGTVNLSKTQLLNIPYFEI